MSFSKTMNSDNHGPLRIRPVPRQLPQGPEGGREPRLWPGDARGTVEQPEPEVPVSPCSTRATRLGDPRSLAPWRSIGTFQNLVGIFPPKDENPAIWIFDPR